MASDNFDRPNENPLASPWTGIHAGTWPLLDLVSQGVKNGEGAAQDTGSIRLDSTELMSQCVVTTLGGRDGGPSICGDGGGDGYVMSNHDNTSIYIYRIDNGTFDAGASAVGVYSLNSVLKLRRSGNDVIASVDAVDITTRTDTTYMTGSPGIFAFDTTIVFDDWTDGVSASVTPQSLMPQICL